MITLVNCNTIKWLVLINVYTYDIWYNMIILFNDYDGLSIPYTGYIHPISFISLCNVYNINLGMCWEDGYYIIVPGGGELQQIFGSQVQHMRKNWTQSDVRFCENEGSKRFKINEKGGQLNKKLMEK